MVSQFALSLGILNESQHINKYKHIHRFLAIFILYIYFIIVFVSLVFFVYMLIIYWKMVRLFVFSFSTNISLLFLYLLFFPSTGWLFIERIKCVCVFILNVYLIIVFVSLVFFLNRLIIYWKKVSAFVFCFLPGTWFLRSVQFLIWLIELFEGMM